MNKKTKMLLSAANALCEELDKRQDLFFKERPFLENPGQEEPKVVHYEEDWVESDLKVKHISKSILSSLKEFEEEKAEKTKPIQEEIAL